MEMEANTERRTCMEPAGTGDPLRPTVVDGRLYIAPGRPVRQHAGRLTQKRAVRSKRHGRIRGPPPETSVYLVCPAIECRQRFSESVPRT